MDGALGSGGSGSYRRDLIAQPSGWQLVLFLLLPHPEALLGMQLCLDQRLFKLYVDVVDGAGDGGVGWN